MTDAAALALQLCPLSPLLEGELEQRLAVIRWFDMTAADQAA